jgi:hypothetical protein
MAFGDKRYTMFDRTPDSSMVLHAATTVSTAATTNGTDIYVGDGAVDIDVVIDITAYTAGTAGNFKFVLIGSDTAAFTNKYILGFTQFGLKSELGTAQGITPPYDTVVGRYLLKASNLAPNGGATGGQTALPCPYIRLAVISGNITGASLTWRAYAGVEMR